MPDKKWRRVVPSPAPLRLVEADALREIIAAGHVVVTAGGGGVPVVEVGDDLVGVEAVVDKDLTAARLALLVEADQLVVLTEVEQVQIGFGTKHAESRPPRRRRGPSAAPPASFPRARWDRRCGRVWSSSPPAAGGP